MRPLAHAAAARCARDCRSIDVRWEPTSGRGRIWSFIVPHPPLLPAFAEFAPYNAIIVELEEDPLIRFVGNLVTSADGEINEIDPATIAIGEPVRVVFHQIDDVVLPAGSARSRYGDLARRFRPRSPALRSRAVLFQWCGLHSGSRLASDVGPPLACGSTWSISSP